MKKNNRVNRIRAFTLMEVVVALAIALILLTALLGLDIKCVDLAAKTSQGVDALPVAIEEIEELTKQEVTGRSEKEINGYKVITSAQETLTGVNMTRIRVEVYSNDRLQADLSLYKFK